MKVWLVEGEHYIVPGMVRKLFATKKLADIEATNLVNIITGFKDGEEAREATPENWSMILDLFVEDNDLDADVTGEPEPWVMRIELEVKDAS